MEKDYCTPINMAGLDGDRYGIYRDGTVINFETHREISYIDKDGVRMVDLHGYKKRISCSIAKLLALIYLKKTDDDIAKKRDRVILIDNSKKLSADNIRWANKLEQKLINELEETEKTNLDFVIPICKLLERGYTVDEICDVLHFSNKLYAHNIKNRRIHKDLSKKYKW